jgi:hypothetical protein
VKLTFTLGANPDVPTDVEAVSGPALLKDAAVTMSQSLKKKLVRSPPPAPPSTVARESLTRKCWPSSDSPWKISSAWCTPLDPHETKR